MSTDRSCRRGRVSPAEQSPSARLRVGSFWRLIGSLPTDSLVRFRWTITIRRSLPIPVSGLSTYLLLRFHEKRTPCRPRCCQPQSINPTLPHTSPGGARFYGISSLWTTDIIFRPILGAGIMVLPFLFGVGVVGILLWYLGIPLSLSTAPIADIAINTSADFSICIVVTMLLGLRSGQTSCGAVEHSLTTKGTVVFIDFLLHAIAFAPLLTSRFQPVRELGWLMDVMLFACTIGALLFVPSALPLAVKEQPDSQETSL